MSSVLAAQLRACTDMYKLATVQLSQSQQRPPPPVLTADQRALLQSQLQQMATELEMYDNILADASPSSSPATAVLDRDAVVRCLETALQPIGGEMTLSQKLDIAVREVDDVQDLLVKTQTHYQHTFDYLEAEVEQFGVQVEEVERGRRVVQREIVELGVHPDTGKIMAERVTRFLDEQLREKETLLGKARLKSASLRVQFKRMHRAARTKEETGEVLQAIDHDQLVIENAQLQQQLEARNATLLGLKALSGRTVHVLNQSKDTLQDLSKRSDRLVVDIQSRLAVNEKLRHELEMVVADGDAMQRANEHLDRKLQQFRAPDVMDYVMSKAKERELDAAIKTWTRKVQIQAMATRK